MTIFHRARIGTTTVASAYTAGSGSLTVADGTQFGSTFPLVVIASRAGVRLSVLEITARATNILTVSGAVDGTTDVNLLVGDEISEGPCALHVNELQDAFNASAWDRFSNLTTAEVAITGAVALTSAAFGKLHLCTGTTADYTVTLPSPTGNAGRFIGFRMSNAFTKFVIIASNASETINGSASRLMWKNEIATLMCDGTNWAKLSGISVPMFCHTYTSSPTTLIDSVYTKCNLNGLDSDNTGRMADLANGQIIIRRTSVYEIVVNTVMANPMVISTTFNVAPYQNVSTPLLTYSVYCAVGYAAGLYFPSDYSQIAGNAIDLRVQMPTGGSSSQTVWAHLLIKEKYLW